MFIKNVLFARIFSLYSLLFIIVLFNSINAQSGKAKSLEIGNLWVYTQIPYPYHEKSYENVVGDTIINELEYAVIKFSYDNSNFHNYLYERADSSRLFIYGAYVNDTTETVFVDFSLEVGDSVNHYVITNKDSITIWGETLQKICLTFDFPSLVHYDDCYIETIGLLTREAYGPALGGGYEQELKAARIGNLIYGDTTLLAVEKTNLIIPSEFMLYQNYPNPFNPSTVISYELPVSGNVKITVYDILGKEVTTLVNNELQPAGMHKIEFDSEKYGLSSGVYFYTLQTENNYQVKKMLLLK